MKKLLFLLLFIPLVSLGQKIYSVNYSSRSDIKVYVVDYESQSDLKVYKVNSVSQARGNDGLWYFVNNKSQAEYCNELTFLPHQTQITSAHCQATVSMGEDHELGILNSRCESKYVKNLVVCDSSSFPTSCGANPMVSIMTMARYQGDRVAGELARYGL